MASKAGISVCVAISMASGVAGLVWPESVAGKVSGLVTVVVVFVWGLNIKDPRQLLRKPGYRGWWVIVPLAVFLWLACGLWGDFLGGLPRREVNDVVHYYAVSHATRSPIASWQFWSLVSLERIACMAVVIHIFLDNKWRFDESRHCGDL
jgi:hypothetical protein